jgi:hypothetical protein
MLGTMVKTFYLYFAYIDRRFKELTVKYFMSFQCSGGSIHTSSSGICGVHGDNRRGFPPITSVSYYQYCLSSDPYSYFVYLPPTLYNLSNSVFRLRH